MVALSYPPTPPAHPTQHIGVLDRLKTRGILAVAKELGWVTHQYRGCQVAKYPVFDLNGDSIAYRVTAFTPDDIKKMGSKYKWSPRKPENPLADWYIAPNTAQHIAQSGGVCWLANGEKSVLAMMSAGVRNVIATTHTETKVPSGLADIISALGIKELRNPADNDEAGRKGALGWQAPLDSLGVAYVPLRWGNEIKGYDANDLWMDCAFDPELFLISLGNLTPLTFENMRQKPALARVTVADNGEFASAIINAINSTLPHKPLNIGSNGFSQNIPCPFHDDNQPSAGVTRDGSVNCFVCGFHPASDVAERFGVDIADYRPKHSNANPPRHIDLSAIPDISTARGSGSNVEPLPIFASNVVVQSAAAEVPKPILNPILKPDFMGALATQLAGLQANCGVLWFLEPDIPAWFHTALALINTSDALTARHIKRAIDEGIIDASAFTVSELVSKLNVGDAMVRRWLTRYTGILVGQSQISESTGGRSATVYHTTRIGNMGLVTLIEERLNSLLYDIKRNIAPVIARYLNGTKSTGYSQAVNRRNALKTGEDMSIDRLRDAFITRLKSRLDGAESWQALPDMGEWWELDAKKYVLAYYEARIKAEGRLGLKASQRLLSFEMGLTGQTVGGIVNKLSVNQIENHVMLDMRTAPHVTGMVNALEKSHRGRAISVYTYRKVGEMASLLDGYQKNAIEFEDFVERAEEFKIKSYPAFVASDKALRDARKNDDDKITLLHIRQPNTYTHHDHLADEEKMTMKATAEPKIKALKRKTLSDPNHTEPKNPTEAQVITRKRRKELWIPEIDLNPELTFTGHEWASWWLRMANMQIDAEGRAVSIHNGRVIYDKIDHATVIYVADHYDHLITTVPELADTEDVKARYNPTVDDIPF